MPHHEPRVERTSRLTATTGPVFHLFFFFLGILGGKTQFFRMNRHFLLRRRRWGEWPIECVVLCMFSMADERNRLAQIQSPAVLPLCNDLPSPLFFSPLLRISIRPFFLLGGLIDPNRLAKEKKKKIYSPIICYITILLDKSIVCVKRK